MTRREILMVFFLLSAFGNAEEEQKPVWLVVTGEELVGALEPLVAHRAGDGLEPVVSTAGVTEALAGVPRQPAYLLLVGDYEKGRESEPWFLPAVEKPLYRWMLSQRLTFASDSVHCDLDRDGVQDIPVGRIPARNAGEVATVAASTNSHPLTNYFTATSMAAGLGGRTERYGDLWFDAQKKARTREVNIFTVVANELKEIEGKLEDEIDVDKLKRDQMLMFAFLGDPATRIRLPGELGGSVDKRDDSWFWRVEKPEGATALEVAFRLKKPPLLRQFGRSAGRDEADKRFHDANGQLGYSLLPAPGEDDPWEGLITEKGLLRLTATGPGVCATVVFELD